MDQRNLALCVSLTFLGMALTALQARACTVFCVVRDGQVLFCNNEDYIKPGYIWFVPAAKGRLARVNLGFDDRFAQGSMNESGLAFDSTAVGPVPWKPDPEKKTPRNLIEQIMNECGTVAQALATFEKFNCSHLAAGQFLFADATGDAAVVAWLPESGLSITRIASDHLIATNTRLGMSGYRCQRFVRAEQLLAGSPTANPNSLAAVLNAVHQRGPGGFTSYSNIFDLKNRKIYLYNLANYEEAIELDLDQELGRRATKPRPLADLFQNSPTLDDIRAGEQRSTWDTHVELTPEQLDKLVGTYSPEQDPKIKIRVSQKAGVLLVENPGQPAATLFPESSTTFRIVPDRGQVTFTFEDATAAQSSGLILHKARDLKAVRVRE
jgi:hypothetical protein